MPSDARHPRDGAAEAPRSSAPGPLRAWGALDRDRQLAALAAVLLFATMLLPWYQQNAVVSAAKSSQPLVSRNLNAFAVFSFVEAAVLLVALAVLVLLYRRAEGRTFQLPGGDGTVVFAAGIWAALLLVLRLFDKPGIAHNGVAANVGVQWGIFFALGAAGLLAYAGSRMRSARRPGPPLLRGERPGGGGGHRPPAPEQGPPRARRAASESPGGERAEHLPTERLPAEYAPVEGLPLEGPPAEDLTAGRLPTERLPATAEAGTVPSTAAGRERYPRARLPRTGGRTRARSRAKGPAAQRRARARRPALLRGSASQRRLSARAGRPGAARPLSFPRRCPPLRSRRRRLPPRRVPPR